jgi:hypothetical protein
MRSAILAILVISDILILVHAISPGTLVATGEHGSH